MDAHLGDGDDFLIVSDVFFDDGAHLDGDHGHDDALVGLVFAPAGEDVDFDGF